MKRLFLVWSVLLFFGLSENVLATRVIPLNLTDLSKEAERIFEGECIALERTTVMDREGKVEIPAVRYTFKVLDAIKGVAGETLIISQLGQSWKKDQFQVNADLMSVPRYEVGKTYILFMNKNFGTGLTTPIGLDQGVFDVRAGFAKGRVGLSETFFAMEAALKQAGYAGLLPSQEGAAEEGAARGNLQKNGAYKGLETVRFKALVREMVAGKIQAPSRKEMWK